MELRRRIPILKALVWLGRALPRAQSARIVVWAAAASLTISSGSGWAGLYKTREQALAEAFPGGNIERKTVFLTETEASRVRELARLPLESKVVRYYVGLDAEGQPGGAAFLDTHVVRTITETVMVLLESDGNVKRVEILAFYEPEDYRVRQGWIDRMNGKNLSNDLTVGRDLVRVTGATLTARALAAAVRRALALYDVLDIGASS